MLEYRETREDNMSNIFSTNSLTQVHGIEVTKKQKRDMTKATKKALKQYNETGLVIVELDDSFEAYKTEEQLKEIAGAVGIGMLSESHYYHVMYNAEAAKVTG
jgi:hypothetical protein